MTEHDAALFGALTHVNDHDDVTARAALEPIAAIATAPELIASLGRAADATNVVADKPALAAAPIAWPGFGRIGVPTGSAAPG